MPKAFISYAWEDESHKKWAREFAERLRGDGVDASLDQWDLVLGDQLPEYMERSIRENDYVLIICTPLYKARSDERSGGVGYEGDIITSEVYTKRNHRKFIPVLREGDRGNATPSWLLGKYGIDLRETARFEDEYNDLLATIHNLRPKAPPVGQVPVERIQGASNPKPTASIASPNNDDIKIEGIIVDEVSEPRMDGTRGSALYEIPFKLSRRPSSIWEEAFIETWKRPPSATLRHRPSIARVQEDRIVLDGTTIEEVERFHRDTLKLAVEKANSIEKEYERKQKTVEEQEALRSQKHKDAVRDASKHIKFD